jgi:Domain of unknown function (DUF4349)
MDTGRMGRPGTRWRPGSGRTLLALAAIVVAAAACSSSAGLFSGAGTSAGTGAGAPVAAASGAEMAPAAPGDATNGQSAAVTDPGAGTAALFKEDAKIVRTGSMTLQVADLDKALARAHDAIAGLGGYVSASTQTSDGEAPAATVTYRVPVDRWDAGLTALRAIGLKVLSEKTDAVEVTGQLVDLAARIRNLQASEQALQAILETATKIPDVLEVQQQLSDVRGQIEQLQAQQALLQDQTAYGTITVTMGPEVIAVTAAAARWDPASEADQAAATLVALLQGVATAGIWFGIVWLPILLVLGVLALVVAFVLRRTGVRIRRRPDEPEPPALPTESPA